MGKSINSQIKEFKNYFGYQEQQQYRNTYIGCECERHKILLVDSDDSMTRIKLVNLPRDLGSNAALCLLKRCIGEFQFSHMWGLFTTYHNANDNHKPDLGILLMRVSGARRIWYTYKVDVHPHQQLPNCWSLSQLSRGRYGFCCPSAQSLKCQVGIVKKD